MRLEPRPRTTNTRKTVMALTDAVGSHDTKTDDAVNAQLAQLEARLVTQYVHQGRHTETAVRDHFQHAAQRFANARIRSFLPILIERAVKAKLV
jgi:hypothetical protein